MARIPQQPEVRLSQEDIAAFWRDGVICVRQLYSAEWRKRLESGLRDAASGKGTGISRMVLEEDYSEAYAWLWNDDIRDFVLDGPSAAIAQQVFGSKVVNFYYDQIFIKGRQSRHPTPWHHDFTFWPLEGDQIASLWTSLDPVDAASSALEFVAGSHRWPQRFKAIGANGKDLSTNKGLAHLPEIDANRDAYNLLTWALEPGDALLFHALTLHGAQGNTSAHTSRRAITTRWCGDDVTYRRRGVPLPYPHGLTPGDPLGGAFFPRILPTTDEDAIAARMAGPIFPDPSIAERAYEDFAVANQAALDDARPADA